MHPEDGEKKTDALQPFHETVFTTQAHACKPVLVYTCALS